MTEYVHKWDGNTYKAQDNYSSEKKCYCVPSLSFVSRVFLSMQANANHGIWLVPEATFSVQTIMSISDNNKLGLESKVKGYPCPGLSAS